MQFRAFVVLDKITYLIRVIQYHRKLHVHLMDLLIIPSRVRKRYFCIYSNNYLIVF